MESIRLGRTNLMASRSGFGGMPIQRIGFQDAQKLLQKACQNGINFFETARDSTDSEEKIGNALANVRKEIIIASQSAGLDEKSVLRDLENSLKYLKTDYIDIYQLHNLKSLPDPNNKNSSYGALLKAQSQGMIRWIGMTSHQLEVVLEAVNSGLYDTVQYPLNMLSSVQELQLIDICKQKDIGLIATKALAGGLITNITAAFTFLRQYDNVIPIWGIERESQLDDFINLESNPPTLNAQMREIIAKERVKLGGSYCRGCGHCMPCPVGIPIPMAARMRFMLRRMPYQQFLTDDWKAKMLLIKECNNCRECVKHCPYQLDTPRLLKEELKDYQIFYENHQNG